MNLEHFDPDDWQPIVRRDCKLITEHPNRRFPWSFFMSVYDMLRETLNRLNRKSERHR